VAAANQSFYEVLGVSRNAKVNDINRAYARIRAEMQREDSVPNPRLAAMAKVAYETLSDPQRRAEYDATLGILGKPKAPRGKGKGGSWWIGVAIGVLAIAGAAGYYAMHGQKPLERPAEAVLTPQQVIDEVASQVGSVRAVFMSGEVRELGGAVAIAADQMVTPCHGMAAGSQLTVRIGSETYKADVMRANEALDVCTLSVKGVRAGVKFRSTLPGPKEALQAVMLGATGLQALQVGLEAPIQDAQGAVMRLKTGTALPNGTPVFDAKARLVGLVTAPHKFGEGIVAMGTARVVKGSGTTAEVATAAAPGGAPSTPDAPAAAAPERSTGGPTLLAEGFTTLWKEDSQLRLETVMDNVKQGQVGVPMAYWTKWSGARGPHVIHCLVTLEDDVVADYDQVTVDQPGPNGYLYCALTRFAVDLDTLPEGLYTFTIFVDGREVAQSSARIEKRFFTRGTWAVIVLVIGMGLLAFLRRGREQKVMSR
jgi:hypothetical protein